MNVADGDRDNTKGKAWANCMQFGPPSRLRSIFAGLCIALLLLSTGGPAAAEQEDPNPPNSQGEQVQTASGQLMTAAQGPSSATSPSSLSWMPRVVNSGPAPVRRPGSLDPQPSTNHFIVVDGASGAVLFERNGYMPVAPASTTKVMTAILGVEHGGLSEKVRLDVDARDMPGSSLMGLEPWFDVTLRDLLYGLMLVSGNDAALAIARHVAGSEEAFVQLMNDKALFLGLRATHFANPHGLDTSDHYSSPYDMVLMARYGMQYQLFRDLCATRIYDVESSNIALELHNLNPLLGYPGADGVKTGLTDSAGRALVGTAARDGHRVFVAFMRSENGANSDGTYLLDWAFDSFDWPDFRFEASR